MTDIEIRPVRPEELHAVAGLRWQWFQENQGTPAVVRDVFVRTFATWAAENAGSHRCTVMLRGDALIGMAWLAIVRGVPTPLAPRRASGDIQCVYVVPEERNGGLGGRLIDVVLALGRSLGLERITVHSSERAIPA
ncbi:GNAT family N-acetyltransferase [Streptomyces sp. NPDC002055]|uniref:GNAT family N-acetyltransferase n=1 Tax=Streptomyces sp. NPDC002055 TaxID=3154534 RepID=UPI0033234CA7